MAYLKYTYRVLPAAREAQNAIERLIKIPRAPFNVKNIPKNPNNNIGNNAYPKVLITLYSGITSDFR